MLGRWTCCRPKKYLKELLEYTDVLIVNTHEFADLVKKPSSAKASAGKDDTGINFKKSVLHLLPFMKESILIVTDGKNGSYGYEGEKVFFCPIVKEKVIADTTGVGDGYTAGFIASYLRYSDVQRAMKSGSRYASKIVYKIGAN